MEECQICVEPINKVNKKINCCYCDFECCKTCFKRYISDNEHYLKCMSCNETFQRVHIYKYLGISFINTEYKKIREELLFEQQVGLMPAAQVVLEGRLEIENIYAQISKIREEIDSLEEKTERKVNSFKQSEEIMEVRQVFERLNVIQQNRKTEHNILNKNMNDKHKDIDNIRNKNVKRNFIKKCPAVNCNAMLTEEGKTEMDNMKCAICTTICCKSCNEIITDNESNHTCDPNILESLKLLEKDTKGCPSCGVPIHKIEGCFDKNTMIPLYDGLMVRAFEIKIGDKLIGIDGNPRTVLELKNGIDHMYLINQSNGSSYIVNSLHKLCLVDKNNKFVRISLSEYMHLHQNEKNNLFTYKILNDEIVKMTFEIKYHKVDKYYGFEIDGDHKFKYIDNSVLSNCDQMFCISCQTAFSWRTLKIENGRIHNPHYFEYIRENGNIRRDPLDIQCGRELGHNTAAIINRHIIMKIDKEKEQEYKNMKNIILQSIRTATHIRSVVIPKYRRNNMNNASLEYRISLLRKQIDTDEFKTKIQRLDKSNCKKQEILDIATMYEQCCIDIIYRLLDDDSTFNKLKTYTAELKKIDEYTNDCLQSVFKVYGGRMTTFLEMW